MRLCITDVAYTDDAGFAACVLADRWDAPSPLAARVVRHAPIADYAPGRFWERELPCLLAVLADLAPDVVVVDGYVWLDGDRRPGLGARLHAALGVPVVGVAKTAFDGSPHAAHVLRGSSAKPLYVTAAGLSREDAAEAVRGMHGPHRVPTLLTLADRACRDAASANPTPPP